MNDASADDIVKAFVIRDMVQTFLLQLEILDAEFASRCGAYLERSGRHVRAEHSGMRKLQRREDRLVGAAARNPNLRVRRHSAQAPVANRLVEHHRVETVVMQVVELRGRPWIWEAPVEFSVQLVN